MKTARREAEEASQLKSARLANINHEFRTPLTSIIGFSEVLTEERQGWPVRTAERIYRSGRRLMETLRFVLELSERERGTPELEREPVRIDRVAKDAVRQLRPRATGTSVVLVTEVSDGPVEGTWNEGAVNRIAVNLFENALKFTPEGGEAKIQLRREGGAAILEVEDTGNRDGPVARTSALRSLRTGGHRLGPGVHGKRARAVRRRRTDGGARGTGRGGYSRGAKERRFGFSFPSETCDGSRRGGRERDLENVSAHARSVGFCACGVVPFFAVVSVGLTRPVDG